MTNLEFTSNSKFGDAKPAPLPHFQFCVPMKNFFRRDAEIFPSARSKSCKATQTSVEGRAKLKILRINFTNSRTSPTLIPFPFLIRRSGKPAHFRLSSMTRGRSRTSPESLEVSYFFFGRRRAQPSSSKLGSSPLNLMLSLFWKN